MDYRETAVASSPDSASPCVFEHAARTWTTGCPWRRTPPATRGAKCRPPPCHPATLGGGGGSGSSGQGDAAMAGRWQEDGRWQETCHREARISFQRLLSVILSLTSSPSERIFQPGFSRGSQSALRKGRTYAPSPPCPAEGPVPTGPLSNCPRFNANRPPPEDDAVRAEPRKD